MGEFFIYSLFFGVLIFLFPVFLHFNAYINVRENRCWYSVRLFRIIKLVGGYLTLTKEGVIVYVGKKVVVVPYGQLADTGKKFEITKGFQLYRFHQIVEAGLVDRPIGVMVASAIQTAATQTFSVLKNGHPFLSLKNSTLLSDGSSLKVTVGSTMIFNGLVLAVALFKKLLEVLLEWIKEKKLTASLKRRRSNSQA